MKHCDVEMQVIDSKVDETAKPVVDILTFRCPICGAEVKKEYPRVAK